MTDRNLSKKSHVFKTPPPEGSPFRVREERGVSLKTQMLNALFSLSTLFRSQPFLT